MNCYACRTLPVFLEGIIPNMHCQRAYFYVSNFHLYTVLNERHCKITKNKETDKGLYRNFFLITPIFLLNLQLEREMEGQNLV